MLRAGRLRHRVDIEEPVHTQDPVTGELVPAWVAVHTNLPAAIEPLSVRDFMASQQQQTEITTNILLRFIPGLLPTMRIRHGADVYNPVGFLPDKGSGLEYVTVPCALGVNEG
jgi:SPP1 family predicted phage head-tail adaptor